MRHDDTVEVPDGWTVEQERLNGNAKLIAEYRNQATGEKVTVSPYKSYNGPGFANSHHVEYWENESTWETVAKGLSEAEQPRQAKEKAVQKMKEVNQ